MNCRRSYPSPLCMYKSLVSYLVYEINWHSRKMVAPKPLGASKAINELLLPRFSSISCTNSNPRRNCTCIRIALDYGISEPSIADAGIKLKPPRETFAMKGVFPFGASHPPGRRRRWWWSASWSRSRRRPSSATPWRSPRWGDTSNKQYKEREGGKSAS